jgi:hypothetical protein
MSGTAPPASPTPGTCCPERPAPTEPQEFRVGDRKTDGVLTYVGKPKLTQFICAHGLFYRLMVTLGFRCHDGVIRRGRFCQQIGDRFAPGRSIHDVTVRITPPSRWPRPPTT